MVADTTMSNFETSIIAGMFSTLLNIVVGIENAILKSMNLQKKDQNAFAVRFHVF